MLESLSSGDREILVGAGAAGSGRPKREPSTAPPLARPPRPKHLLSRLPLPSLLLPAAPAKGRGAGRVGHRSVVLKSCACEGQRAPEGFGRQSPNRLCGEGGGVGRTLPTLTAPLGSGILGPQVSRHPHLAARCRWGRRVPEGLKLKSLPSRVLRTQANPTEGVLGSRYFHTPPPSTGRVQREGGGWGCVSHPDPHPETRLPQDRGFIEGGVECRGREGERSRFTHSTPTRSSPWSSVTRRFFIRGTALPGLCTNPLGLPRPSPFWKTCKEVGGVSPPVSQLTFSRGSGGQCRERPATLPRGQRCEGGEVRRNVDPDPLRILSTYGTTGSGRWI